MLRPMKAVALACAVLGACAAILLALSAGATAAAPRTPAVYDAATQSHPGACSRTTLNVPQAVGDLSANGVLGQYAVLVGVHDTGAALRAQMTRTLVVLRVASTTVTSNHGCTTDGVIFSVGSRTLTAGETVGVGLPGSIRAKLCRGSTAGCERRVLTEHTVFPTNCWNLDQGSVRLVVYLHKPHARPKHKQKAKATVELPRPSASVRSTCGTGNAGTSTVTLRNGRGATAAAAFVVNGKHYGPVAAGHSISVRIALSTGTTGIRVSSGGNLLVDQRVPADDCPAPAPTAKAALSCAAGGVVVTLSNAPTATADATFLVNGTSYGPLAPGATTTIIVPVAAGASGQLTVTSGGRALLGSNSYTNSCSAAGAAAFVGEFCVPPGSEGGGAGGGVLVVQLSNGSAATLPASFSVTATGTSSSGYGPATIGPLAAGASQTLLIPIDASGSPVTLTVSSGGTVLLATGPLSGCPRSQVG